MGAPSGPRGLRAKGWSPLVTFSLGVLALLTQLALRCVLCIARTSAVLPVRFWPSEAL